MIRRFAFVALFLLAFIPAAGAQSGSAYFAGGTAIAPSSGPLDTLGAGTIYETPRMGGFFETVGGDFIFFHHLGIGAEYSFRKDKGPYAGLEYQPKFYDVNAVYQPLTIFRRFEPEIQAGVGKAKLSTYYTLQTCYTLPQGCAGVNAQATSVNEIQAHAAAGLRIYAYRGIFIRPQVDVRWVNDKFGTYFGSPWVTQYSVAIGYTLHRKSHGSSQN